MECLVYSVHWLGIIEFDIRRPQLACSSLTPESEEELLLISTQRMAYLVNINKEIAATNPAGIKAPPETHLLPITPASIAATTNERWKFAGFWEV